MLVYEAAVKAGAPEGIVECLEEPTVEMSGLIMANADVILATGGPGMVKAAYSSGKPAIDDLAANASAGAVIGYLAMKLR